MTDPVFSWNNDSYHPASYPNKTVLKGRKYSHCNEQIKPICICLRQAATASLMTHYVPWFIKYVLKNIFIWQSHNLNRRSNLVCFLLSQEHRQTIAYTVHNELFSQMRVLMCSPENFHCLWDKVSMDLSNPMQYLFMIAIFNIQNIFIFYINIITFLFLFLQLYYCLNWANGIRLLEIWMA